ncbi:MAG: oxidoreductase [Prolixibacteraceae bacterium]|nr:oxidoreductase [Prolixibacteraceae bacterium]
MTFKFDKGISVDTNYYRVSDIKYLTAEAFIITLPKSRFSFKAGQHISLSIKGDYQSREYSIYSGENEETFQILVKEVEGGYFSPKLKNLKEGDLVEVHGPFGRFGLDEKAKDSHKHVFIASGTGISPFHSIIKSNPGLNYEVIHGVRYQIEGYEHKSYDPEKYTLCTSRDSKGNFNGRLTEYLKLADFEKNTIFYLCGNSNMIFDAMEILKGKGFGRESIKVEVYF